MKGEKYRLLFMGTPEFSVPSLIGLASTEQVTLVVTNPDRPRGRGRSVVPPPVKVAALDLEIPVYQPEKIKQSPHVVRRIADEKPDVIVVVAYGKILPPELLEIPEFGCINIHASILPKYRGAAPINWAIINGEKKTGISIMRMDEGMDTGPVLLVKEEPVYEDDTAKTLSERLSRVGAEAILEAMALLKESRLVAVAQDDGEATYAPMLKKETGRIEWAKGANKLRNFVRGLYPWPAAHTTLKGRNLKVIACEVEPLPFREGKIPGEITEVRRDGIVVQCGEGKLLLTRLQPEGKKEIDAWSFVQGYRVTEGLCLGT